jgi:hypothetical protein
MVSGNDQCRSHSAYPLEEQVSRLELAVARALGQVTGHRDRGGLEAGEEAVEGLDLFQVGKAAEMEIGEMDDGDSVYQMTLIR